MKFYYEDRVKIIDGFYKGHSAIVEEHTNTFAYRVRLIEEPDSHQIVTPEIHKDYMELEAETIAQK